MARTNEEIILNSTGESIIESINAENALLASIAESKRSTVYGNISQVASIVRQGHGASNFPIGDQIIVPWKDMNDANHNTDANAYQVAMDIVHHGNVELEDGEIVPGMFLQWHLCSPYGVQFSNYQAFMNCPEGLAAGTYTLSFAQTWSQAVAQSYQFTLTQDVPVGGKLSGFERGADVAPANYTVKSWASPVSASPIETVAVTIGSEGTDLGTLAYTNPTNGYNSMQRTMYGYNRWKTSAIRQYLNKSGSSWFASQEDFDIRPNEYTKNGFLTGFGEDFLSAIKPIKVTTVLNTVEGLTDASETTFDKIFLPSLEQMNVNPQLSSVEGPYFEYWRRRLALSGFAAQGSAGTNSGFLIPAVNSSSLQNVRLRSANRGLAHHTWNVSSSGDVNYSHACNAFRFSPVCVIC